jgi:hypothetical protein
MGLGVAAEQLTGERRATLVREVPDASRMSGRSGREGILGGNKPLGLQSGRSAGRVSQFHVFGIVAFAMELLRRIACVGRTSSLPDYGDFESLCSPVLQTRLIARCRAADCVVPVSFH